MPAAGITIKVTGLTEAVAFFNKSAAEIHQTTQAVLNEGADLFVSEATKNAHVITGRMKASIYKGSVQQNSITVGASAPYSAIENKRPGARLGHGPHDFATRALNTTADAMSDIIQKAYDELLEP